MGVCTGSGGFEFPILERRNSKGGIYIREETGPRVGDTSGWEGHGYVFTRSSSGLISHCEE